MSHPLAIIVVAQLLGTSLWFTPNGVSNGLIQDWGLSIEQLGFLASAVQLGFITGTLVVAFSGVADRFRASLVFACSALLGAAFNGLFIFSEGNVIAALVWRFLTGLALAGVYPLGMKLVVSWVPHKTGYALGWLVGMLTLGTSLPHLMQGVAFGFDWRWVVFAASFLATTAAFMVYRLGDGEFVPVRSDRLMKGAAWQAYRIPQFRAAAIAYFGHCWELYAFWTLVPIIIAGVLQTAELSLSWIPWLAFIVVAIGLPGCLIAGAMSREWGSARTAFASLFISGLMCFIWPLIEGARFEVTMFILLLWGLTVIADSAQYSALAADSCPKEYLGSALALMNSIGFFMTVLSISLTTLLYPLIEDYVAWVLLIGPVVGLWSMRRLVSGPLSQ